MIYNVHIALTAEQDLEKAVDYIDLILKNSQAADELFMRPQHLDMWTVVETADEVLEAIKNSKPMVEDLRQYAKI